MSMTFGNMISDPLWKVSKRTLEVENLIFIHSSSKNVFVEVLNDGIMNVKDCDIVGLGYVYW
jgi:hypothetical protein